MVWGLEHWLLVSRCLPLPLEKTNHLKSLPGEGNSPVGQGLALEVPKIQGIRGNLPIWSLSHQISGIIIFQPS
jgi:hypothetical protein